MRTDFNISKDKDFFLKKNWAYHYIWSWTMRALSQYDRRVRQHNEREMLKQDQRRESSKGCKPVRTDSCLCVPRVIHLRPSGDAPLPFTVCPILYFWVSALWYVCMYVRQHIFALILGVKGKGVCVGVEFSPRTRLIQDQGSSLHFNGVVMSSVFKPSISSTSYGTHFRLRNLEEYN